MKMRSETFEGRFVEHLLVLRMRHRDDQLGPLLEGGLT